MDEDSISRELIQALYGKWRKRYSKRSVTHLEAEGDDVIYIIDLSHLDSIYLSREIRERYLNDASTFIPLCDWTTKELLDFELCVGELECLIESHYEFGHSFSKWNDTPLHHNLVANLESETYS